MGSFDRKASGHKRNLSEFKFGFLFGDLSVLSSGPSHATVRIRMQYAVQSVHPCPNANWGPAVRQQSSSSTRSLRALPLQTKRSSLSSASSRKEVRANAGQWLESSAQIDVPVPLEHAWSLWEDRTRIPTWMPWITSVEVLEEDPSLSKWTLSTYQFERQVR